MNRGPPSQLHKMCFDTVCVRQCDGPEDKEYQHIHTSAEVKILVGYASRYVPNRERRRDTVVEATRPDSHHLKSSNIERKS